MRQQSNGSDVTAEGAGGARPQARGAPARGSEAAGALGAAARWRCCPAVGRRGALRGRSLPGAGGSRALRGAGRGRGLRATFRSSFTYLFICSSVRALFLLPSLSPPGGPSGRTAPGPAARFGRRAQGRDGAGPAARGGRRLAAGRRLGPPPWQCLCPRAHAGVIPLGWRGRAAWPGSPSARSSRSSSASAGPSPAPACTPPTKVRRGRPALPAPRESSVPAPGGGPSAPLPLGPRAPGRCCGPGPNRCAGRSAVPRPPRLPPRPPPPAALRERRRAGARGASAARDGTGQGSLRRERHRPWVLGAGSAPPSVRGAACSLSGAPLAAPPAPRAAPASGAAPRYLTWAPRSEPRVELPGSPRAGALGCAVSASAAGA